MLDWKPFAELVHRHNRFLLTTHVRPDGDGLGSMLALSEALERLGKSAFLLVASAVPQRYRFLDPKKQIHQFENANIAPVDAIIILDTGTWNQLGEIGPYIRTQTAPKIVIDHHITQDDLAALPFVDVGAEATGRLACEAITALGVPLSPSMADMLFAALAMDTGWFRHSNVRAETMTLAGELVGAGANPQLLYQQLFEQDTLPRLKLTGLVLDRLQVTANGKVAFTEVYLRDYPATGATPQDTEDLINYTRSIVGVEVGLFFVEQPRGGVKVSFRSRKLNVARVAEQFAGGGHRVASGATVDGPIEQVRARVLEAVAAALHAGD